MIIIFFQNLLNKNIKDFRKEYNISEVNMKDKVYVNFIKQIDETYLFNHFQILFILKQI